MEGILLLSILAGMGGVAAGLVTSGFWEAFCLITARVEPSSGQIGGLAMGGGCLGVTLAVILGVYLIIFEGA